MNETIVLARTQRIVVNPMSHSISVVNSGPQGPAGVPGTAGAITTENAQDIMAAALVPGDNITATYDDPGGTVTIAFKPEEVVHDWNTDGWTPWTTFLINDDVPLANDSSQTLSVVNGRGRITNSNTQASMRKAYTRNNAGPWMNSEVQSLIYGSDIFRDTGTNPSIAQGGHFHRAYTDGSGVWRAIVITNNIFLTDVNVINGNVWNSDPTQPYNSRLKLGSNGGQKTFSANWLRRDARIVGVDRFVFAGSINEYYITPANGNGMDVGTWVTVDALLDNTFDVATAQQIQGIGPGLITLTDAEAGAAVTYKAESGQIIPTTADARRYWPYWVKSRLIGSKLWTKVWREKDPEPDWSNQDAVAVYDFQGAQNPSPNSLYPTSPGYCGIIGNHIRNGRILEYGHFSAKKLA